MSPEPRALIHALLRSAGRRVRALLAAQSALWALTLGCLLLLLGIGAEALKNLWPFSPPVFTGFALVVMGWAVFRTLYLALRSIPADHVAFLIEQVHPELKNALISSVQLTAKESPSSASSPDLLRALLENTSEQVGGIRPQVAADRSRLRRPLLAAVSAGAVTLAVGLLTPGVLKGSVDLLRHPVASIPSQAIVLEVSPKGEKVLLGGRVKIHVEVQGRLPKDVSLELLPETGAPERVKMSSAQRAKFSYETGPVRSSFTYRAFAEGHSSPTYQIDAIPPPVIEVLSLHYLYPRYTGLAPDVQEGRGDVRGLKGTEITLELQANKPVRAGRIVFGSGNEFPLEVLEGRNLRGQFLLLENDDYRILLEDQWGFENLEPVRYPIEIIPDEFPAIELIFPTDEVFQVDSREVIPMGYVARDDFGIGDIRVVAEGSGVGRREDGISRAEGARRLESGQHEWDLGGLPIQPGSVLRVHLEAKDNDQISGPKVAVSRSFEVRVSSPHEDHQNVRELQREIAERLIGLLGDQLELEEDVEDRLEKEAAGQTPVLPPEEADQFSERAEHIEQGVKELLAQIGRTLQQVARDPLSGFNAFTDLNTLRSNLSYLRREMIPRARRTLEKRVPGLEAASPKGEDQRSLLQKFQQAQKEVTAELERMALLADDIGKRSGIQDLANIGERLAQAQNQLLDAFDQALREGSLQAREALSEALKKVEELLQELARGFQNLPIQLPDEFLNSPLGELADLGDLSQRLQEIQRHLEAGALEEARRLAEELIQSLSQMIAALQGAIGEALAGFSQQFGESAGREAGVLEELLRRQRAILEETQDVEGPLRERLYGVQEEGYEAAMGQGEEALDRLDQLSREVPEGVLPLRSPLRGVVGERANTLEESLEQQKVPEAVKGARALAELSQEIARRLESVTLDGQPLALRDEAVALAEEFRSLARDLEGLPKDPRLFLTPEEGTQLTELEEEQRAVQEETDTVHRHLEELSRVLPFIGPEVLQNLKLAKEAMGKAAGHLLEQETREAIPPEQEAVYRLSRARSNTQRAMGQLARRGRFGASPAPGLVQPGGSPSLGFRYRPPTGPEEGGRTGVSARDFQLPAKDAYKVPKLHREEVVEALKGKYPPAYKEQIERYFKNLVE